MSSNNIIRALFIKLIKLGVLIGFAVATVVIYIAYKTYHELPDPAKIINSVGFQQGSQIYDRTGKTLLYKIAGDIKRTFISEKEIPNILRLAIIAAEDDQFYTHKGISIKGVLRALWHNFRDLSFSEGGSTITQQFVRNYFLTREKTLSRKLKEILLTYKLERQYTKDEILHFYLNQIPFGSNVYGVEEAARFYFSKSAGDLNLAESSILAALIKAPSTYSPYNYNPQNLKKRQEYILQRMEALGFITKKEREEAQYQTVVFSKPNIVIKAPHFVMHVVQLLEEKFGKGFLEKNGLKIITTLDFSLQQTAEDLIIKHFDRLHQEWKFDNIALVAIDPKSGDVLSLVGSKNYFAEKDGAFNVVTQGLRQPGSSIKPLIYATLFEKGYTPETILFDVKTNFSTDPTKTYIPQNYDLKERGPVMIKEALAQSLNIPAIKALYLAGLDNVGRYAKRTGLESLDVQKTGLSLVLGGGAVRLIDLVGLYAIFANDGIKNPPIFIKQILDNANNVVWEAQPNENRVFSAQSSRIISSILSDNNLRAPIFGENSYLKIPNFNVAVKTGTSQDFRDAWAIGFTPTVAAGVWIGNNNYDSMKPGADGSKIAAPLLNEFMNFALKTIGSEEFLPYTPIETKKFILNGLFFKENLLKIDTISNKLATEFTPPETTKTLSYKEIHSELYWLKKDAPQDDPPINPSTDPQFQLWEDAVIDWATKNFKEPFNIKPVEEYDDIHTLDSRPQITIHNISLNQNRFLNLDVSINAKNKLKETNIFVDDELVGSFYSSSINETLTLPDHLLNNNKGFSIKIESYDIYFNKAVEERLVF